MKQHITTVEIFELPEEARKKLLKWSDNKGYSGELTIGQMIES